MVRGYGTPGMDSPDPDRVDHEILFYFVQRVNIPKLIFMYLQQKLSPG